MVNAGTCVFARSVALGKNANWNFVGAAAVRNDKPIGSESTRCKDTMAIRQWRGYGTFRTCRTRYGMSVLGGRTEVAQTGCDFAF
jgi:hypothetical protein